MLKKILIIIGAVLATASLAAYFVFVGFLAKERESATLCSGIEVTILDSLDNRFVSEQEVKRLLTENIGKNLSDINLQMIEDSLVTKSAIAYAEANTLSDGNLEVHIRQRKPVMRLQSEGKGHFVDLSGYILPIDATHSLDLPFVTGTLPFNLPASFRGFPEQGREWISDMVGLAQFISGSSWWSRDIEQIVCEPSGDLVLYTRTCGQKIIFGQPAAISEKFAKLKAYYTTILPNSQKNYSTVNLKFKDQIVCK